LADVQTGFAAGDFAAALDSSNPVSLPGLAANHPEHSYTFIERSHPFWKLVANRVCEAGKIGKGKKVGNLE